MRNKNTIIKRIKTILEQDGGFTTKDVEAESSPLYKSWKDGSCILIERFGTNGVDMTAYKPNGDVAEYLVEEYENLDKSVLEEIERLAEDWSAICYKTTKRASN